MKGLRLDKYLWFARLAKSRTLAQESIASGEVRINGERLTNRHAEARVGQVLTLTCHGRFRVIRVEQLPLRRGPAKEAQATYIEIVAPQPIDACKSSH
jgi:ribosome-associated heat shock protein Hsp15